MFSGIALSIYMMRMSHSVYLQWLFSQHFVVNWGCSFEPCSCWVKVIYVLGNDIWTIHMDCSCCSCWTWGRWWRACSDWTSTTWPCPTTRSSRVLRNSSSHTNQESSPTQPSPHWWMTWRRDSGEDGIWLWKVNVRYDTFFHQTAPTSWFGKLQKFTQCSHQTKR